MYGTRWIIRLMLSGFLLGAAAHATGLEYNVNRAGNDIGHVPNVSSPGACAEHCRKNNRCVAFTWVRPNYPGKGCWLKARRGQTTRNNCCISGTIQRGGYVKESVTPARAIELPDDNAGDKTGRGCVCVAPDGRRYRHAWGQPGCPAPDSGNADYRSCR